MLTTLINGLDNLRNFLSTSFFIGAFLPTLLFTLTNFIILFLWSWPVHDWINVQLTDQSSTYKTVLFTVSFLLIWSYSYVISALTPLWIRTLEGKNWFSFFLNRGREYHLNLYKKISEEIDNAEKTYLQIGGTRGEWNRTISNAKKVKELPDSSEEQEPCSRTYEIESKLKNSRYAEQLIKFEELESLVSALKKEHDKKNRNAQKIADLASQADLLIDYAYNRAVAEHSRLLNIRNMEFGDQEEIAPTRFGNVGLAAQAYAMRAYHCNITRIWSTIRRVIEKEESARKSLEKCKSQLDFFVASFWLSLLLAFGWGLTFSLYGEFLGAFLSVVCGPLLCWLLWYGAAVEQYRILQELIISSFNAVRFQVLKDLRLRMPEDLMEERGLWRAIDFSFGDGQCLNLGYLHQDLPASATAPTHPAIAPTHPAIATSTNGK